MIKYLKVFVLHKTKTKPNISIAGADTLHAIVRIFRSAHSATLRSFVLVIVEASQIYGVQIYLDGVEGYEEDISKLVDLLLSILSRLDRI